MFVVIAQMPVNMGLFMFVIAAGMGWGIAGDGLEWWIVANRWGVCVGARVTLVGGRGWMELGCACGGLYQGGGVGGSGGGDFRFYGVSRSSLLRQVSQWRCLAKAHF
ncbi:hypothetical protein [Cupriavidus necator]